MEALGSQILRRKAGLESLRSPHENTWRDCARYSFPMREDGFQGTTVTAEQGQSRKAELLDGTSTDSCELLAAGLMSGMTPANAQWAEAHLPGLEEGSDGARFLDESSEAVWENIHAANFDAEGIECMRDATWAGWCALFVDEDREQGGFTFEWWHLAGLLCSTSKAGGLIDTVYRTYKLTVEQCIEQQNERGWVLPQHILDAADKEPDRPVEFVRAIYPRKLHVPGSRRGKNLPVADCIVDVQSKQVVYEGGFHEMPVIVARWARLPNSVYATGPMFNALPDTKELNELTALEKQAIEMSIAPPLKMKDDGVLNPKLVKIGPRMGIICADPENIQPLYDGARIDIGWTAKDRLQAQIRKTLMSDQLQPADGPAMTATEVHVRVGLIRQLLGPIYGRFQAEWLAPLFKRCFGLMLRRGALGQPPQELAGREASIEFSNPLARAQKYEEVVAGERWLANVGALAAAKPKVLDIVDEDKVARDMGSALGVPSGWVRSVDDTAEVRRVRAQMEQEQQQQEAVQPVLQQAGIEAAKKAIAA